MLHILWENGTHPSSLFITAPQNTILSVNSKMSRNDINPRMWGPHLWIFIDFFLLSLNFEAQHRSASYELSRRFFETLHDWIPCTECRDNYQTFRARVPFPEFDHSFSLRQIGGWITELKTDIASRKKESTHLHTASPSPTMSHASHPVSPKIHSPQEEIRSLNGKILAPPLYAPHHISRSRTARFSPPASFIRSCNRCR